MRKTILTLTTCHNRHEKTLIALQSLINQNIDSSYDIEHYLVDDSSNNLTRTLVAKKYPSVNIIIGDGNLFWAGGMRYGYEHLPKSFDYLILYNDDIEFYENSLKRLIKTANQCDNNVELKDNYVLVASFKDRNENFSYGGVRKKSKYHPLLFENVTPDNDSCKFADTLNMNLCLVPIKTLMKYGFLSDKFKHSGADFEYGLRLTKNSGKIIVSPGYYGLCDRNDTSDGVYSSKISLIQRYKRLFGVKGQPLSQRWHLYYEYGGIFWFVLFLKPYLTLPIKHIKILTIRWLHAQFRKHR